MLSSKNYSLLKSYCTPHTPGKNEGKRFEQLRNQNFITIHSHKTIDLGSMGTFLSTNEWVITELGKDALNAYKEDRFRFRCPLTLSIVAIIISIISMLLQLLKLI